MISAMRHYYKPATKPTARTISHRTFHADLTFGVAQQGVFHQEDPADVPTSAAAGWVKVHSTRRNKREPCSTDPLANSASTDLNTTWFVDGCEERDEATLSYKDACLQDYKNNALLNKQDEHFFRESDRRRARRAAKGKSPLPNPRDKHDERTNQAASERCAEWESDHPRSPIGVAARRIPNAQHLQRATARRRYGRQAPLPTEENDADESDESDVEEAEPNDPEPVDADEADPDLEDALAFEAYVLELEQKAMRREQERAANRAAYKAEREKLNSDVETQKEFFLAALDSRYHPAIQREVATYDARLSSVFRPVFAALDARYHGNLTATIETQREAFLAALYSRYYPVIQREVAAFNAVLSAVYGPLFAALDARYAGLL